MEYEEKLVQAYTKAEAKLSVSIPQENELQATPIESMEPEKLHELHLLDQDAWNWAQYRAKQLGKDSVSQYLFDLLREEKKKGKA
jgi:hypothetical protein